MNNQYKNERDFNGEHFFIEDTMEGAKDVFLSYKRENVKYVVRLYHELKRHFISSWLDISELPDHVGDEYKNKIHGGIDNSKYFLLIYTKDVEESDFIIDEELAYAKSKGKKILFYPKDTIDLKNSRLSDYVKDIQWMDTEATAIHQDSVKEALDSDEKREQLFALINTRSELSRHEDQSLFLIRIALQRILCKTTVFGNYQKLCGAEMNGFYRPEDIKVRVINKGLFISPSEELKKKLEEAGFYRKDKIGAVQEHISNLNLDESDLVKKLESFMKGHENKYSLKVVRERLLSYKKMDKFKDIDVPEHNFSFEDFKRVIAQIVAYSFLADLEDHKVMFNGTELGVYSITDGRVPDTEYQTLDMELYYSDYFTFKCMTEMYHVLCSIDDTPFVVDGTHDISKISPFLCSLGLGGFVATKTKAGAALMWAKRSANISSGEMWHFSYDETVSLLKDSVKIGDKIMLNNDNSVTIDISKVLYRALKEEVGATGDLVSENDMGLFEVGLIKSERLEVELITQAVVYLDDNRSIGEQIMEMHDASSDGYLEISDIQFLSLRDANSLVGKLLSPESYNAYTRMKTRVKDFAGKGARVGDNTIVEYGSYIEDGANVGDYCKIHRNVYIGKGVKIGDYCKIQNNNSIYQGVTLEDGVFVGTNVSFINDKYPRAINERGQPVTEWNMKETLVKKGASIGAGAVIMCGVTIHEDAMVGAGAVVLKDVPAGAVVVGNPAKEIKART